MSNLKVRVPVILVNALNAREHWAERARRAKQQRASSLCAMSAVMPRATAREVYAKGATITILRCGGRRMDDDGLAASAKHVRDGVADWLGIDDGDKRLTWRYEQMAARMGERCVVVEVTR